MLLICRLVHEAVVTRGPAPVRRGPGQPESRAHRAGSWMVTTMNPWLTNADWVIVIALTPNERPTLAATGLASDFFAITVLPRVAALAD
jgi:hypothetical protein